MKMKLLPLVLVFLFSCFLVNAVTESALVSPVENAWVDRSPFDFVFSCGGNSTSGIGYNATLYTNISGSWKANVSLNSIEPSANQNFTYPYSMSDGFALVWNVECKQNVTGEVDFDVNETFRFDNTNPTVPDITNIDNGNNGTTIGGLRPRLNWTNSSESNFLRYQVELATDAAFTQSSILRTQIVSSRTTTSLVLDELDGLNRVWWVRVLAFDEANNTNYEWINFTFVSAAPVVNVTNYTSPHYSTDTTPGIEINVIHQSLDICELHTNYSGTWKLNRTISNRINGSKDLAFPSAAVEGLYVYSVRCNNTGNNMSAFTPNRTIVIDTTAPSTFGCLGIHSYLGFANNSKSLNHRPKFHWNSTSEPNFGNYTLQVDNNSDFTSPEVVINISQNNASMEVNLRNFDSIDRDWYWTLNATDLAGNKAQAINCSPQAYRTDVTNHLLHSGWNMVGIVREGSINASDIALGLGNSWVTISYFNQSKQFLNHNNGSATNGGMLFRKGDAVFINVNAETYFENQTWDTSVNYHDNLFNLTNTSSFWNVMAIQNQSGWSLEHVENLVQNTNIRRNPHYSNDVINPFPNTSIQFITGFNNSAVVSKRFVSHPYNTSLNNESVFDFGEVVWINLNASWNLTNSLSQVGFYTINLTRG